MSRIAADDLLFLPFPLLYANYCLNNCLNDGILDNSFNPAWPTHF